jgi:hypothetical protein
MPEQKILVVRLSRDEMHVRMFKATVYEIFRLEHYVKRLSAGWYSFVNVTRLLAG